MNDINSVILNGRLTRDADLKYTAGGSAIANFGIAVNEKRKGADGAYIENVSYFDVELWGKYAEAISQYLSKGSQISVLGKLKQDRWKAEDGTSRNKVKITASTVQLLGSKNSAAEPAASVQDDFEDDVPF